MTGSGPVMSAAAVEAAASSAWAVVTYPNLKGPEHPQGPDPAYPFVDGGFWGVFQRSLEGRWELIREAADEDEDEVEQADLAAFATDGGESA